MRSLSTTPQAPGSLSRPASRQSSLSNANSDASSPALKKKASIGLLAAGNNASRPAPAPRATRITATKTTTTTAPAPRFTRTPTATPASSRTPLRQRDQNVASTSRAMKPKLSQSTTGMSSTNANSRQPQMPVLAPKAMGRAPITPKIAARASTPQHQTVTISTPAPRRTQRPESSLSNNPSAQKDDAFSPVPSYLNSNITPRSGHRQSRVESASSTPNGTPIQDRGDTWDARSGLGISGAGLDGDGIRRGAVLSSPPEISAKADPDSKFFYASDAPKQQQQQQPLLSQPKVFPVAQKPATFFYANGNTVEDRQPHVAPATAFTPILAPASASTDSLASKFIYANGTPDLPPPGPKLASHPPAPGSTISTASRLQGSRPGTASSTPALALSRPASPIKLPSYPPPKNASTPALLSTRSPPVNGAPILPPGAANLRRTSVGPGTQSVGGHSRSGSLTIADAPAVARIISTHGSLPLSEASSPSSLSNPLLNPPTLNLASGGFASLLQAADDFAEEDSAQTDSLQSPTKSTSGGEHQLNDLVVNARRERKVQDLQITNASLEAINRTLERQLRKQTAELRRYRRLSRSGRLSMNSMGTSRIASDSSAGGGGLARAGLDLDDLSEEESEIELEEEEEEDDDLSESEYASNDGQSVSSAVALRDTRYRKRDERRLQLDLSKHQQLLVDSQKMNQSLKRCLGWTEELIKEGRRALEYQVRVSEVKIGGRVLHADDVEEREPRVELDRIGEDSDEAGEGDDTIHGTLLAPDTAGTSLRWAKEPQDRDSGIELPVDEG